MSSNECMTASTTKEYSSIYKTCMYKLYGMTMTDIPSLACHARMLSSGACIAPAHAVRLHESLCVSTELVQQCQQSNAWITSYNQMNEWGMAANQMSKCSSFSKGRVPFCSCGEMFAKGQVVALPCQTVCVVQNAQLQTMVIFLASTRVQDTRNGKKQLHLLACRKEARQHVNGIPV